MTPTVQILQEAGRVAMERRVAATREVPPEKVCRTCQTRRRRRLNLTLTRCSRCRRVVCKHHAHGASTPAPVCSSCALSRGFGPSSRRVS